MFQPRNRPSLTEWAERKPMIEQLYLEQNRTLEEVSAILAEDDFHATIRQYKTRLKSWGYDNKKIRADVWKAMSFALTFLKRHNQQAVFLVPVRGGQVKEVGQELIGKQMRRTTGYLKDLAPVLEILAANGIDISCSDLTTGKKLRYDHTDFSGIVALSPPSKNSSVATHTTGDDSKIVLPQASNSFSQTPPSTASHVPETQSTVSSVNYWSSPDAVSPRSCRIAASPIYSPQIPGVAKSAASQSSDDFDIMSAFRLLSRDNSCSPVMRKALYHYVGSIFPTPAVGCLDEEKRKATQWIAYYVLTLGPEHNIVESTRDEDRSYAMDVFKSLLVHHSRFIYPFCSSVIMILGTGPPDDRLKAFLNDCCEVIDSHMRGQEMNYGSPFHVARALWLQDTVEIDYWEKSFARSTENIGFIWGKESPNYIVNQHYYAWLKLHKHHHQEAINLLQDLLPKSQAILGRKHPLTINCFATLSRAQDDLQNFDLAIIYLRNAIDLLNEHSTLLDKYRDRLRRRLALLLLKANNLPEAEALFRQILEFRLRYFGIESGITWNVIKDLKDMLAAQGRLDETIRLDAEMNDQFTRASYHSYVAKNGHPPDWSCTVCNDPVCRKQCVTSPAGSQTLPFMTRTKFEQ